MSAVDWDAYFLSIKHRCPWAYTSWNKGTLQIVEWGDCRLLSGRGSPLPIRPNVEAVVYVMPKKRIAKKLAKRFICDDEEWFYSYPAYGPFATPVPTMIQQCRKRIDAIRERLNHESV